MEDVRILLRFVLIESHEIDEAIDPEVPVTLGFEDQIEGANVTVADRDAVLVGAVVRREALARGALDDGVDVAQLQRYEGRRRAQQRVRRARLHEPPERADGRAPFQALAVQHAAIGRQPHVHRRDRQVPVSQRRALVSLSPCPAHELRHQRCSSCFKVTR